MSNRFPPGMYVLTPEGLLDKLDFGVPVGATLVARIARNLAEGEWLVTIWRRDGETQFSAYNLRRPMAPLAIARTILDDVEPVFTTTNYDALITATKLLAKE